VSKLDAYKGQIVRWLDTHPYSAQQIFQRLREAGYDGRITIVKDYVHRIRPRPPRRFSRSISPQANAPKSTGENTEPSPWAPRADA